MYNMGAPVTGSDLPFWGSLSSPRGHPSADLHASHSTDPGGACMWKVPNTPLRFTVSQLLSALVLSAQIILCPLPRFLLIAHHHRNIHLLKDNCLLPLKCFPNPPYPLVKVIFIYSCSCCYSLVAKSYPTLFAIL